MKKEYMVKRIIAFIAVMALVMGIAPLPGLTTVVQADAGMVSYVDENGETKSQAATALTEAVLTAGQTEYDKTLPGGWYVVSSDVSFDYGITLGGDVNLILADGKTMNVEENGVLTGIYVEEHTFTIYGQSKGTGILNVTTKYNDAIMCKNGSINIHGGIVNAVYEGESSYSGIVGDNSSINITGGKVTAESDTNRSSCYGIYSGGGLVSITGGQVNAIGNYGVYLADYGDDYGDLILGYTKESDYINISRIELGDENECTVTITPGQTLYSSYKSDDDGIKNKSYSGRLENNVIDAIYKEVLSPDTWGFAKGRDGSKGNPFVISNTAGLDILALRVNSYGLEGCFELDSDITYAHDTAWNDATSTENNYTPIGGNSNSFTGSFNGNGHTISGIRIYRNGDQDIDCYLGLFGSVWGDENSDKYSILENIFVSDTRISGHAQIGGIVGESRYGSIIKDCHVTETVALYVNDNGDEVGGIVGDFWDEKGIINGCTSAVAILAENKTTCMDIGGIAGFGGGKIENCIAVGVTIPDVIYDQGSFDSYRSGAIVGYYDDEQVYEENYYSNCLLGDKLTKSEIGVGEMTGNHHRHDVFSATVEGVEYFNCAVPANLITLPTGVTADAITVGPHTVSLSGKTITLNGTGSAPSGYRAPFLGYTVKASDGTEVSVSQAAGKYTFTMPDDDVTVTTKWTPIPKYAVTVNNGTGGGQYEEGTKVTITADNAPAGKVFDKWISSDGVTFADAGSVTTSFTMPGKAVTVTATYKDVPTDPTTPEDPVKPVEPEKPKSDITITLSKKSFTYNGKVQKPKVTAVKYKGKKLATKYYTVTFPKGCKNAGTYTIKVALKKGYSGTETEDFTINKAANTLSVKAKKPEVQYKNLTKGNQTLLVAKVLDIKKAQGKVSYEKIAGNENITVNTRNGKVTLAKNLPKATYKTKIKVTAAGGTNYKPASKTVTVKIKVK